MKEIENKYSGSLPLEDAMRIVRDSVYGVLCTAGEGEGPYAVPVNYAYENGTIYIHGKSDGTKVRCLTANPDVCFCITGDAELIPEERTTRYQSVILYGKARMSTDKEEKRKALNLLMDKYAPGVPAPCMSKMEADDSWVGIIAIAVSCITGKSH